MRSLSSSEAPAICRDAATDIALRATTLPGYSPSEGTFVRTLLQIDARALTFVDGEDGKQTAAADVLGMVFDQEGTEVAHLSTGFAVALTKDAADEALRDGLVCTLRIPIPRSGATTPARTGQGRRLSPYSAWTSTCAES